MNPDDSTETNIAAERPRIAQSATPQPLTDAHLEPWLANVVDVTMRDGSHRIGLLQRIERGVATLRPIDAEHSDPLVFRVSDARRVGRALPN